MRRMLILGSACLLVAQSKAIQIASVAVSDGEQTQILQGRIEDGTKPGETIFTLPQPVLIGGEVNGFLITSLSVKFNQDPSIAYGVAVIDFGLPSSVGFVFGTPIIATANPASVQSTFSASFTDAGMDGAFSSTPPVADPDGDGIDESQVFEVFDGVLKNAGIDLAAAFAFAGAPGTSGNLPAESAGFIAAPAGGPFTGLQLSLSTTLSGGGDIFTANGLGEIVETAVPDAGSSFALLGIASIGLGALSRFRQK
jgi:hypothetical protein